MTWLKPCITICHSLYIWHTQVLRCIKVSVYLLPHCFTHANTWRLGNQLFLIKSSSYCNSLIGYTFSYRCQWLCHWSSAGLVLFSDISNKWLNHSFNSKCWAVQSLLMSMLEVLTLREYFVCFSSERNEINVHVTLTLAASYYNGMSDDELKTVTKNMKVPASNSSLTIQWRLVLMRNVSLSS